jgi:hypothetical protein
MRYPDRLHNHGFALLKADLDNKQLKNHVFKQTDTSAQNPQDTEAEN